MAVRDFLQKKPFYRVQNSGLYVKGDNIVPVDRMKYAEKKQQGIVMTQTDFIEEYEPSGHRITNELFFPESYNYGEIITEDGEKTETMYREETFRVTVPLQKVTAVQHLVHLYGNDTHHELADSKVTDDLKENFFLFQTGWLSKNIDIALYGAGKSQEITGDKAIVFFMYKGKCCWKVLSFLNGDTLYPNYDPLTGELDVFARKFFSYDETGKQIVEWVEIYDDKYIYRYRQSLIGAKGAINKTKKFMGMEDFELVSQSPHGFSRCPVAYDSANDAGWGSVQPIAEEIEVALSYWAKACASTANDAYIMKGDDVEIKGDPLGRVRAFTAGKDDSVSLLEKKSSGDFYRAYVERLFKEYFRGSFTCEPPELKSGDTPAAAIKLIYSPNLDLAILQAKEQQGFVNQVRSLFCEGYGMEISKITEFLRMEERILSYLIPFVHENTSEKVNNLVALKGAGLMCTETGAEHNPYATNAESDKIFKEQKLQQAQDRLNDLRNQGIS